MDKRQKSHVIIFCYCNELSPHIYCLTVSAGQLGPLLGVSQGPSQGDRAEFLSGGSVEESISKLIQVFGRIQFLAVVGLRAALSSKWPLSDPCTQPLYLRSSNSLPNPSAWNLSAFLFCPQLLIAHIITLDSRR